MPDHTELTEQHQRGYHLELRVVRIDRMQVEEGHLLSTPAMSVDTGHDSTASEYVAHGSDGRSVSSTQHFCGGRQPEPRPVDQDR